MKKQTFQFSWCEANQRDIKSTENASGQLILILFEGHISVYTLKWQKHVHRYLESNVGKIELNYFILVQKKYGMYYWNCALSIFYVIGQIFWRFHSRIQHPNQIIFHTDVGQTTEKLTSGYPMELSLFYSFRLTTCHCFRY